MNKKSIMDRQSPFFRKGICFSLNKEIVLIHGKCRKNTKKELENWFKIQLDSMNLPNDYLY